MRILIIAGIFPPDIGGPANYIPKFALAMHERGHRIRVISFSDVASFQDDLNFPFPIHRIQRRQLFFIRELKTIWNGIRHGKDIDIIYANGNDFKAWIIGAILKKPVIHKIVGDTSWERAQNKSWTNLTLDEYQTSSKSAKLSILDFIRSFPLRRAKAIITPSHYLKKLVLNWDVQASNIHVVYNAMEPLPDNENDFHFEPNPRLKWMVTVCRLVPWKGVDTLIKVLHKFPNLGLIIVGDGPLEGILKNLTKSENLSAQVIFLGRQPRSRIKEIFKKSCFFILNSSYEGLPHVVLEAMSCQKIVLASQVGGTPEVVSNGVNGLLFDYNDSEKIENCIAYAITEDHQNIVSAANQKLQTCFSFEAMIKDTEQIFNNSLNSNRRA